MRLNFTHRFVILGGVLLLHVIAFYALSNFILFTSATLPVPQETEGFLKIALPPKPVPPPMAPTDMPKLPDMAMASSTPSPMPIVANTTLPKFNVPMSDETAQAMADHIPFSKALNGNGQQAVETGQPSKTGNDPVGNTVDIDGLKVPATAGAVVIIDNSSSMLTVDDYVQHACSKLALNSDVIMCNGCTGHYVPGDTTQHGMLGIDFYFTATAELKNNLGGKPPEALIMVSDWEDGAYENATAAFIASLRERHIRLYLLSVECTPYQGLIDYAHESGGQVSMTTKLAIIGKK